MSATTWQMIYGTVPLIIISILMPSPPIQWTPVFIAALLYNIILVCVIAFLLWFYVLEKLQAGMATMGTLVTPVLALIFARIQLGEIPSSSEGLGIILTLSGIGLLGGIAFLRNRRKEKQTAY